jgi:hypothetical protein
VIRGNRKNVKPIAGIIPITATAISHCYHLLSSEQEGREPTNERWRLTTSACTPMSRSQQVFLWKYFNIKISGSRETNSIGMSIAPKLFPWTLVLLLLSVYTSAG